MKEPKTPLGEVLHRCLGEGARGDGGEEVAAITRLIAEVLSAIRRRRFIAPPDYIRTDVGSVWIKIVASPRPEGRGACPVVVLGEDDDHELLAELVEELDVALGRHVGPGQLAPVTALLATLVWRAKNQEWEMLPLLIDLAEFSAMYGLVPVHLRVDGEKRILEVLRLT